MIKKTKLSIEDIRYGAGMPHLPKEGFNLDAPYRAVRRHDPLMFEEEIEFTQEYEIAGYLYLYSNGLVDTK